MFDSYKIVAVNARGLLVDYFDSATAESRRLNLLLPYDANGMPMDDVALKRHIISSAPIAAFADEEKAKADFAAIPLNTSVAVTQDEITAVLGG